MKGSRTSALAKILDRSLDLVFSIDKQGRLVQANASAKFALQNSLEELEGQPADNLFLLSDSNASLLQILESRVSHSTECLIVIEYKTIPASISSVWSEEDECYFCIAYLKQNELLENNKLSEMNRLLTEQGEEMHALIDEFGNYVYGNWSYLRKWGYDPEGLVGMNAFTLIHPDDVPAIEKVFNQISQSKEVFYIDEFRFRTVNGEWRWLTATISNQLENPYLKAYFSTLIDITPQKEAELRLLESENRFRDLFDNNPDMIIYQDKAGLILDANPAFMDFHRKSMGEVLNRPVYEFLPYDAELLSIEKHNEALTGKKVSFVAEINFKELGYKVLSIKKMPLIVKGNVVAFHVVLRDITSETLAQRMVEQQAKKLNTIFESITDAFCTIDKQWNFTYLNSASARILGVDIAQVLGQNCWNVIPEEAGGIFHKYYIQALESNTAVHFVSFLQRADMWLEVKAFPSEEGLSIYFDDITDKVHAQQELEKLSLVAQKTTNSVIITDALGYTEWVNEGFTNLTGYTLSDIKDKYPLPQLCGLETNPTTLEKISEDFQLQKPFTFELLIYKKSGAKFWCYTEVTPIFNELNQITKYIAVQSDISIRKEEETQLLKMAQDLYQKNSDLQQFTYIISHNLRAPVANALGFSDLLLKLNKDSERFDPAVKYLKESITRLDGVLRDVSQILSVRDQKDTVGMECINILSAWEQAQADMLELLEQFGGKVEVSIEDGLTVQGNRAYLHSIFYNLLSNAIKYRSNKRPLHIKVKAQSEADSNVVFSFSDNGSGLDMQKVGKDLFKMYKRFHTTKDGKGIGLFLVKSHVEAMEGSIEVNSQVEVGTTFTIHLKEGEYSRTY